MSILSQAFQHTLDARERVVGVRETVNINGTDVDALVETLTFEDAFVDGGIGQDGGYRCQISVNGDKPAKFSPIIIRGKTLQVLSVDDINGIVYHLTAGDPASER